MKKYILFLLILIVLFSCEKKYPYGTAWQCHIVDNESRGADGVRLDDVNSDGLMDITTGWEEGGITKVYLNPGKEKVKMPWPSVQVGRTGSVEDAVFVDLDSDGNTDVISCCEGKNKRVYVHWAPKNKEQYLDSLKWKYKSIPVTENRMQWMFCMPMQVDDVNGIDLICAGKNENAELGWLEAPENPRNLDDYKWHPITPVGWVMSIISRDMDGDGDEDILISDRRGERRGIRWLERPNDSQKLKNLWRDHLIGASDVEVMFIDIVDIDNDKQKEILAAAKPDQIIIYKNLGSNIWAEQKISFPENTGSAKAVSAADFDKDGQMDLVFTCEHAQENRSGVMWLKKGDDQWIPNEISGPKGIKYDRIELIDLDKDGDMDVLTCEERQDDKGLGVIWYENPG